MNILFLMCLNKEERTPWDRLYVVAICTRCGLNYRAFDLRELHGFLDHPCANNVVMSNLKSS